MSRAPMSTPNSNVGVATRQLTFPGTALKSRSITSRTRAGTWAECSCARSMEKGRRSVATL